MRNQKSKSVSSVNPDIDSLDLVCSPFYDLIDVLKRYKDSSASIFEVEKHLKLGIDLVTSLLDEEVEMIDNLDLKMEMIGVLEGIGGYILELFKENVENENIDHLNISIEKITKLNSEFIRIEKKGLPEQYHKKKIPACSFFSVHPYKYKKCEYKTIKDIADQFLNGDISERKYMEFINREKSDVRNLIDEFGNLMVTAREWEKKLSPGDKLLMEGIADWEKALLILSDIFSTGYRDNIKIGLNLLLQAESKLSPVKVEDKDR